MVKIEEERGDIIMPSCACCGKTFPLAVTGMTKTSPSHKCSECGEDHGFKENRMVCPYCGNILGSRGRLRIDPQDAQYLLLPPDKKIVWRVD